MFELLFPIMNSSDSHRAWLPFNLISISPTCWRSSDILWSKLIEGFDLIWHFCIEIVSFLPFTSVSRLAIWSLRFLTIVFWRRYLIYHSRVAELFWKREDKGSLASFLFSMSANRRSLMLMKRDGESNENDIIDSCNSYSNKTKKEEGKWS